MNAPVNPARKQRLRAALVVTATFLGIEVVGGLWSGSLALLADAGHMLTDVAALLLSYAAMTLAERRPTDEHTFGMYRGEILAAFVNAQVLLLVSVYILYEAWQRWSEPEPIATGIMLWVAIAGLGANLLSMRLLHGEHESSLNVQAAYLEVLTDLLGSIAVIVAALLIRVTGWSWLDPLVSAGIGLVIVPRTVSLLRQSAHILLEGAPPSIDVAQLRQQLAAIPEVSAVHDLHLWTLTSGRHIVSAHLRAAGDDSCSRVLNATQRLLREQPGIEHSTIQVDAGVAGDCQTSHCAAETATSRA